jgi:short-subunit dehydrogenase
MKVVLAARNIDKLQDIKEEINAQTYKCDSSDIESVSNLFKETDKTIGTPNLVVYNPSVRLKGSITELDPKQTQEAINVTCYVAFLVEQEASKRMLKRKNVSIFFTGASASIKGFANSSVFAMGKFGLRGLAQSLARELHPKNIHIGHFIIDGGIGRQSIGNYEMIDPVSIAKTYLQFHNQDKSVWSWEIELRTWIEKF